MLPRFLLTSVLVASLSAHYTWLAPFDLPWLPGKSAKISLRHGHKFPASEEAIDPTSIQLFVDAPSGTRTNLAPKVNGSALEGLFPVKESGVHRVVFVSDRGVVSRTPGGVLPGGRDKNPDAALWSTAQSEPAWPTSSPPGARPLQPLGFAVEMTARAANGAWEVTLLRQGKPVPGVDVEVFTTGASATVKAGVTGPSGAITYKPSAHGPAMFAATVREAPPAGAPYDSANFSTSLHLPQ